MCTIDVVFPDSATYDAAVTSQVLSSDRVARLYGQSPDIVRVFNVDAALAIKISLPRLVPAGDPADRDIAAGQQFAPLLDVELPSP